MDEYGGYDGWTEHTITVRPDLIHTIVLGISGRNRNDIKDYLYDVYHHILTLDVRHEYDPTTDRNSFMALYDQCEHGRNGSVQAPESTPPE